jgi:hypothetical protein
LKSVFQNMCEVDNVIGQESQFVETLREANCKESRSWGSKRGGGGNDPHSTHNQNERFYVAKPTITIQMQVDESTVRAGKK